MNLTVYIIVVKGIKMNFSFKQFLENTEEKYHSEHADIPLPKNVYTLSDLFTNNGFKLFVVGGAIRDYLYSIHHGGNFEPKDVDLATEAPPDKVIKILESPEAREKEIKAVPKGVAFGVISAIVNGEEFEIATFREDGQYTDGRRPNSVSFSTPAKDSARRDLTINALFYDIHKKEIRDYNLNHHGVGQGFEDIKNLVARPVGNARDRFREDKLRIPRLIRFFSRFNPGYVLHHLDKETLDAIKEFKDLVGVSPERIAVEFTAGLQKSAHPVNYIKNYAATGLIPAVFPNLKVDLHDVDQIGNTKNIKAVLAWLLKSEDPSTVRTRLNKLTYSSDTVNTVSFLLKLFKFNPSEIADLIKKRDLYKQLAPEIQDKAKNVIFKDIQDFAKISGQSAEINHFLNYNPTVNSDQYLHLSPAERGKAMKSAEENAYRSSLKTT